MEVEKNENRKRYFREYYINNKDKYRKKGTTENKTKRGRPKKKVEPFKIIHLEKPITISFN